MSDDQTNLRAAYKRAGIGMAVAAVLGVIGYIMALRFDWGERSIVIPIGAAGLSVFFFSLYARSKHEE